MIGSLALNSPGEICRELLDHEDDLKGLLVVAFTPDGYLTWGMTGTVSTTAMLVAINVLTEQLQKINSLAAIPPEGSA